MSTSMYVSRINQIDAIQLDREIYKVLKNQVRDIIKYLPPGKVDKWQAEIDVVLQFLIWNFSLRSKQSTLGQQLLNLHYPRLSKTQSFLYLILSTLPLYIQEKVNSKRILPEQTNVALRAFIDKLCILSNIFEIINLITFLHKGIQPSIIERILGIFSQPVTTHKPRNIGYSYMTRELIWHGLIELFTMGLPMINFHYWKQLIRNLWIKKKYIIRKTFPIMDSSTLCCYCKDTPIIPTHAGCEHIFCYYCLKANFTAVNTFICPDCDTELFSENLTFYTAPKRIMVQNNDLFR